MSDMHPANFSEPALSEPALSEPALSEPALSGPVRFPDSDPNRRDFLKTAAAASIGGSLLISPALSLSAYADGNQVLKVALIGCGNRGSGAAAQALSTGHNVKLWAMADAFPDRLESSLNILSSGKAGNYNVGETDSAIDVPPERRFIGLDAYRKAIESGVDVVIITGPPGFRPIHFEYAVNAGKHVFMEKPLASDPAGVRRILASAAKAKQQNLKVGVGLQRHHDVSYQEAIRRIHDGELGRVVSLQAYWNGGPPAKTAIPRKDMTELEYQVRNWYFFDWLSGDHICEQHIHNLDVCNWIMKGAPVEAEGMGGRQVRTGKEYGNIFDHHAVKFTYDDGTKMFSYCRQTPGCSRLVAEYVDATNGTGQLRQGRCSLTQGGEKLWQTPRRKSGKHLNPYQVEHDVLFDAILNDKPHMEAEYGALSTMTAILGRFATYSGKVVKWKDAFNSDRILTTDAEEWTAPAPVQALPDGGYAIPVPGLTEVI